MDSNVIVIGGGLAGLVTALELARAGIDVLVIEKRQYPAHKVCGEYVSNEIAPYLESLGLSLSQLGIVTVTRLAVSSPKGTILESSLESGGFGLSRYSLDFALYQRCLDAGVRFLLNTSVSQLNQKNGFYEITTSHGTTLSTKVAVGAYGKRSILDVKSGRAFTKRASPYMAVKYHIRYDHPRSRIHLHNFEGGYCGMSAIEDGKTCLCYLTTRDNLKKNSGNLKEMEATVLSRNPHLKKIFSESEFLYKSPLVINEISFQKKDCIENGVFMTGDSAGLITPLCGNGMAMAVHAASILSQQIISHCQGRINRSQLEYNYRLEWKRAFRLRLTAGRLIQASFGKEWMTEAVVSVLGSSSWLTKRVIGMTHGSRF